MDAEIDAFRREIESYPMIWANAILDLAGEYTVFNQQLIERDILKRLESPLPSEVRSVLEDALRRARSLEPTRKEVKHYTSALAAELELDVPGELLEPAIPEVREKRRRQSDPPAPRIDIANTTFFVRLL